MTLVALAAFAFPAAASACDDTTAQAGAATPDELRSATLCLVNAERAKAGLRPLAVHPLLTRAATAHARDMVTRRFFAHDSPGGSTLLDRLRAADWLPSGGGWRAGENIAWGSGSLGRPAEIVKTWMRSPGHRANILQPGFTQIGIGVLEGTPRMTGLDGLTYVTDFGDRAGDEGRLLSDYATDDAAQTRSLAPAPASQRVASATGTTAKPAARRRCTTRRVRVKGTRRHKVVRRCVVVSRRAAR